MIYLGLIGMIAIYWAGFNLVYDLVRCVASSLVLGFSRWKQCRSITDSLKYSWSNFVCMSANGAYV